MDSVSSGFRQQGQQPSYRPPIYWDSAQVRRRITSTRDSSKVAKLTGVLAPESRAVSGVLAGGTAPHQSATRSNGLDGLFDLSVGVLRDNLFDLRANGPWAVD